ncbi:aldehyde dehydrogenase family protein [Patulibacter defluvii]|uniref:aldehyde dehydrogenase family protein n=1 Tax=Patulibacter defluvii TaxID=3095358 RepID=UPI002A750E41|nr:aldehyde dehydrogenase family protein [Patulibacter sp. DM4]
MSAPASLTVRSPYDGAIVGEAPLADRAAVRAALARGAERAAEPPASRHQRSRWLHAIADAVERQRESLARGITAESGLALKDTRTEAARTAAVFRFAAAEALVDRGESFAGDITADGRDRRAHTLQQPAGLVAAITPFNLPLNQVAHKLAPAIAAGAPIVVKPSERTPLSGLRLGAIVAEAGVPAAAATVLAADPEEFLEEALAEPRVAVLAFTGSVAVGKAIADRLGYRRAMLELGGNDPLIVLADADLDEAAALAVTGAFRSGGQRCTAVKRILAAEPIADALVERIVARTRALSVGDPADERTDVGPLISAEAAAVVEERIAAATAAGARRLTGGERDGALLTPAVLDQVPRDAALVREETFGPVAPVVRVADLDDAIAVANATPYALSSGVCTRDLQAAMRCVRELRAGTVNVREMPGYRTDLTPFGGVGDSGLGVKEGIREAVRAMSVTKLYTLPWD